MSDVTAPQVEPQTPWWRSGKVVVAGIGAALVVGWFFYRQTVPPPWMRAFGADIALRAVADPNAALPADTREATPRGQADNPLICLKTIVPQAWDRIAFLTHAQARGQTELLPDVTWVNRAAALSQLAADDRYQIVVLMNEGKVIDSQLFYTFWGDLSGVARAEGFTPDTAIFTAESRAGHYVLAPANATLDSCPK